MVPLFIVLPNSIIMKSAISTATTELLLPIGTECVICLDGPRMIALLPCKHLCLCKKCYNSSLKKCLACANEVVDIMDIVPTG